MEAKRLLKYFLLCGSAYFTIICGATLLILEIMTSSAPQAVAIEPSQFLLIFPFSFSLSLGSTVRRISSIPKIWGWIANAVCYIGGFSAFLLMCGVPFSSAVIAIGIFAVIYAAVAAFVAFTERKKIGEKILSDNNGKSKNSNVKSDKFTKTDKKQKDGKKPYENLFS